MNKDEELDISSMIFADVQDDSGLTSDEIDEMYNMINGEDNTLGPRLDSFRVDKGDTITLDVPSYVKSIDVDPNTTHFDNITVDAQNENYEACNNALYTKGREVLLKVSRNVKSFVVDDNTKVIGKYAFSDCEDLKSVSLPEGLNKISDSAFYNCKSLETISIPKSVKDISDACFSRCPSLKSVNFEGNNLTYLGIYAFQECSSLEEVTLPSLLENIPYGCFMWCSSLKSIKLPTTVKDIGDHGFAGCTSLETIDIPSSVSKIGDDAFDKCVSLSRVTLPDNSIKTIGTTAFHNCTRLTSFNFPSSLIEIGECAFAGCKSLKDVTINKELEKIHLNVFNNCLSLKKLYIPEGIKEISLDFSKESYDLAKEKPNFSFAEISVCQDNDTYVSYDGIIYKKCDNSVFYIPDGIKNCIDIKEGVANLPSSVFEHKSNITSLNLPASFSVFDSATFSKLENLKEITIDSNNPLYTTEDNIVYSKDKNSLVLIPINKTGELILNKDLDYSSLVASSSKCKISKILIGKDVKHFPISIFSLFRELETIEVDKDNDTYKSINGILYNKKETKLLLIPHSYKGIINIPESVKSIDREGVLDSYDKVSSFTVDGSNKAFYALSGVLYSNKDKGFIVIPGAKEEYITIPNNYVNDNLCPNFTKDIKQSNRAIIYDKDNIPEEEITTTKQHLKSNYKALFGRESFSHKVMGDEKIAKSYLSLDNDNAILLDSILSLMPKVNEIQVQEGNKNYVSIDGVLYSKDRKSLLYCPKDKEGVITVLEGTTRIMPGAFYNCNKLSDIVIPHSVSYIGDFAFTKCENLTNIYLPSNLDRISKGMFMYCSSLNFVVIPDSVEFIDDYAFSFCSKLSFIDLPKDLVVFNTEAFYAANVLLNIRLIHDDNIKAVVYSNNYRHIKYTGQFGKLMSDYIDQYGLKNE